MNAVRKRKLYWIMLFAGLLSIVAALILYALRQNINLFYTPSQVQSDQAPHHRMFRMGGLVKPGSIQQSHEDLTIQFLVTDLSQEISVIYRGILPDLFREGKGVVVQGQLNAQGIFVAQQVLAKHDENYRAPEVVAALTMKKG